MARIITPRDPDLSWTLEDLFDRLPEARAAWEKIRQARPQHAGVTSMAMIAAMIIQDAAHIGDKCVTYTIPELQELMDKLASEARGKPTTVSFDTEGKARFHDENPGSVN